MASTYSPALRIELMATGDQSGTWGVTTNTNLGTLLEQAITGVLSVAEGDTTLTLTSLNGASDQARNAVVNLTGAMTAARNVVVPTSNKVYLVKNSTTGGFIVTVKTSAGSGVEIAPGTARWVYCDGTNVVDAIPGLSYGYATTATAAGTTTLTYGSGRQQFFTGSSTQTVALPVASTMTLGQQFEITNNSTGTLTVNSSGGNLVQSIAAGTSALITCILTSGTTAASWSSTLYSPLSLTATLAITGSSVGFVAFQAVSTEAAAAAGPIIEMYRNSASPAANDVAGQLLYTGQNSTPAKVTYAFEQMVILDATAASEDAAVDHYVKIVGANTRVFSVGPNNPNTPTQFVNGYATTATAAGTTTLTVLSAGQQYFTGTSTQTVVLPVTSTLVLGQQYRIVNNSTGAVTVQSSGANTIVVVGAGIQVTLTCILTSGTTAASWDYKFGTALTLGTNITLSALSTGAYTGLRTGLTRVTYQFSGLSTNGISTPRLQLGTGGSYVTTGYNGAVTNPTSSNSSNYSTGAQMVNISWTAGKIAYGTYVCTLENASNGTWVIVYSMGESDSTTNYVGSGSIILSGPLERIQLVTTDTYDAGEVNLLIE